MNADQTSSANVRRLTSEVRLVLSKSLISRVVQGLGIGKIFYDSQSWDGYKQACESWHLAFWSWIDQQTPADVVRRLADSRMDYSTLPPATKAPSSEEAKERFAETRRQEYLVDRVLFLLAMSGPEASESSFFFDARFERSMKAARLIGDKTYVHALATQKQRKPTKDVGGRRLKPRLLFYWIPGCLWAFTADGIAEFLNLQEPGLYNSGTIRNTRRSLKLYHPIKPLWWGMRGEPLSLIPL